MINERQALIILEGILPADGISTSSCTKTFYRAMQMYADASLQFWESGKAKKLETHLKVVSTLFEEGNETVKNAIINVYLFTLSYAMDRHAQLAQQVKRFFAKELLSEYHRFHLASGL